MRGPYTTRESNLIFVLGVLIGAAATCILLAFWNAPGYGFSAAGLVLTVVALIVSSYVPGTLMHSVTHRR